MIAVIPARAGSKGIKGKNHRRLYDRPLIEHSIDACILADVRPVISTDCSIIRGIAYDLKVECVRRPPELATDTAVSELAVIDAITQIGYDGSYVLMVQCTTPLTQAEDIRGVVGMLELGYDSVFTASKFHGFIWDGCIPVNHSIGYRPRRQDMKQYLENGAVYGFTTEGLLKHKHRFFGDIGMYEMPVERSLEIDEPYQLILAEALIRKNAHVNLGG